MQAGEAQFTCKIAATDLAVVGFSVSECLSSPYAVDLELASEEEIGFDAMIGREGFLRVYGEDADRYFHGIVSRFMQTGSKGRYYLYRARLVPALWLLSLESDCRIFQNQTVPDIVKQVLQEGGVPSERFDFRLQKTPGPREYCVQYRESDLDFISRLLEEEGIFYFFEHDESKHVAVFADSTMAYKPIAGETQVTYKPAAGMVPEKESVYGLAVSRRILSGKMTRRDYNFEKPGLDLTAQKQAPAYAKLEVYDYPGKYLDQRRGNELTQVRLQESVVFTDKIEGQAVCRRFTPGLTFTLTDHDRSAFNREYLLTAILHQGVQPQVLKELADSGKGFTYSNDFTGIPADVVFRPERRTPRSRVEGAQTAVVVGPAGEEIYTDKFGRVKVKFHWDREVARDEKSSCWLRVAQFWAGKGWGAVFTPRIGDEVLVDFLEGDPDKPIVVGSVYNQDAPPLYPLPDDKSRSVVKTKSYPRSDGFNELRFEDKAGSEEIYLRGQKDWTIQILNDKNQSVGHDETLQVSHDRTKSVENDQSETIGANKTISVGNNHSESIEKNRDVSVGENATLSVGKKQDVSIGGDASLSVGKNQDISVTEKQTESVGKDYLVSVGKNHKESVGENLAINVGKKTMIGSGDQLSLSCGSASIVLKSNGDIIISGSAIQIKASGNVVIRGSKILQN